LQTLGHQEICLLKKKFVSLGMFTFLKVFVLQMQKYLFYVREEKEKNKLFLPILVANLSSRFTFSIGQLVSLPAKQKC
jgi:hypothetical protein